MSNAVQTRLNVENAALRSDLVQLLATAMQKRRALVPTLWQEVGLEDLPINLTEAQFYDKLKLMATIINATGFESVLNKLGFDGPTGVAWLNYELGKAPKANARTILNLIFDQITEEFCGADLEWFVHSLPEDAHLLVEEAIAVQGDEVGTEVGIATNRWDVLYQPLAGFSAFEALPTRAKNCLKQASLYVVGDLLSMSQAELLREPYLGRKSLNQIKEAMLQFPSGLTFGYLSQAEETEFVTRRWFHAVAWDKLIVKDGNWTASADLVEKLRKLDITYVSELVTYPNVLSEFGNYTLDLKEMVEYSSYVLGVGDKFKLTLPRQLNSDVKIYKPLAGE